MLLFMYTKFVDESLSLISTGRRCVGFTVHTVSVRVYCCRSRLSVLLKSSCVRSIASWFLLKEMPHELNGDLTLNNSRRCLYVRQPVWAAAVAAAAARAAAAVLAALAAVACAAVDGDEHAGLEKKSLRLSHETKKTRFLVGAPATAVSGRSRGDGGQGGALSEGTCRQERRAGYWGRLQERLASSPSRCARGLWKLTACVDLECSMAMDLASPAALLL